MGLLNIITELDISHNFGYYLSSRKFWREEENMSMKTRRKKEISENIYNKKVYLFIQTICIGQQSPFDTKSTLRC